MIHDSTMTRVRLRMTPEFFVALRGDGTESCQCGKPATSATRERGQAFRALCKACSKLIRRKNH